MIDPVTALDERFEQEGLRFPSLPEGVHEACTLANDWHLSSRPKNGSPYAISEYVSEFVDAVIADLRPPSVVLAHAGHGKNSWALHYFVVVNGLGVFLQSAWGGAATDEAGEVAEQARFNDAIARIDDLVAAHIASPLFSPDERTAIIQTDFGGSRWARWASGGPVWAEVSDAIDAATESLVATPD